VVRDCGGDEVIVVVVMVVVVAVIIWLHAIEIWSEFAVVLLRWWSSSSQ